VRGGDPLTDLPHVLRELGFAPEGPQVLHLADTYLDTADQAVQKSGWALRDRRGETEGVVRTFKQVKPANDQGISERQEHETHFDTDPPLTWNDWQLGPQFTIHQHRTLWLAKNNSLQLQASVDTFHFTSPQKPTPSTPQTIIELEMLNGDPSAFQPLVTQVLQAAHSLHPGILSKYESALRWIVSGMRD